MSAKPLQFVADLDRCGRYARESIEVTAAEVRVSADGGAPHLTLPRSRVSDFQVESYVSSGALFARVDGAPLQIARFTNSRLLQAASFVRALHGAADAAATQLQPEPAPEQQDAAAQPFTRWSVLRRILRFAPRSRLKLALVVAALLLHTAANVAAPYLAGTVFFDRVLQPGGALFGRVGLLVAVIVVLRLAELAFRVLWGWFWAWYHHRTGLDLRVGVFAGVHRLSLGFFANSLTGSLLTRMNRDMNSVGSLLGIQHRTGSCRR